MKAKILQNGQIQLPAEATEALNLEAGTELELVTQKDKLVIFKSTINKESPAIEKWRGKGRLPFGQEVEEYLKQIR